MDQYFAQGTNLIHWDGLSQRALTFEKSTRLFTFHVQSFGEGWLLGEGRSGRADICDNAGRPQRTLDLGDAINDVQTTPNGHIWVSYFDEECSETEWAATASFVLIVMRSPYLSILNLQNGINYRS